MKKAILPIVLLATACVAGFLLWKIWGEPNGIASNPQKANPTTVNNLPTPVKYPVGLPSNNQSSEPDSGEAEGPISTLDDSDRALEKKAKEIFSKISLEDVFVFDGFIRHFVVAIDNATGRQIPAGSSPIKQAPGELVVKSLGNELTLSPKNYKRYGIYMEVAQGADLKKIVAYYQHIYPLFQAAYDDLGTQGYFNDKVIEAIDGLLQTPDIKGPIHLKRQSVRYEFANPSLESLSAIQKILIRMGPKNSTILKSKFKELRDMLSHLGS